MDLGREVPVQRAEGDLRGLRDLAHLDGLEPAPAGEFGGGLQDAAATGLLAIRQGWRCRSGFRCHVSHPVAGVRAVA
ncbi:hypothetical protein JCM13580A_46700 [Streptomyces drozdowiczii]